LTLCLPPFCFSTHEAPKCSGTCFLYKKIPPHLYGGIGYFLSKAWYNEGIVKFALFKMQRRPSMEFRKRSTKCADKQEFQAELAIV
jgi:hypothetical protein